MMPWVWIHCALAASASPASIVSCSRRIDVRMAERRIRLRALRRAFWRIRFFADLIIGILK